MGHLGKDPAQPGGEIGADLGKFLLGIRPADRDEMMTLGYLQGGVSYVVKPYGVKGP